MNDINVCVSLLSVLIVRKLFFFFFALCFSVFVTFFIVMSCLLPFLCVLRVRFLYYY